MCPSSHKAIVYTDCPLWKPPRPVPNSVILNKPYTRQELIGLLRGLVSATSIEGRPERSESF